ATERCCTELILTYGALAPVDEMACPVCAAVWSKTTEPGWVPPRQVFVNQSTGGRFTIEQGPTRRYLAPDLRG
ncbi:MAG: hypothetical protein NTZ05_12760, partial [Chloroflexi bacterium]|nr:hypothetical protein [Chloroflexota bacterium]